MPKKYIYIALGVILLAGILYLAFRNKNTSQSNNNVNEGSVSNATSTAGTSTSTAATSTAVKKTTVKAAPAPLSATQRYLDAIKIYKTAGYYFQFVDCHGLPGSLTLKKGKKFMLDNRDAKTRKIAIQGGQSFQIKSYDFAIATAPSTIGTHYITCDGGGAASILVQP